MSKLEHYNRNQKGLAYQRSLERTIKAINMSHYPMAEQKREAVTRFMMNVRGAYRRGAISKPVLESLVSTGTRVFLSAK